MPSETKSLLEDGSRSSHVSDPSLRPFLDPNFDAADYLNSVLPPVSLAGQAQPSQPSTVAAVSVTELSSQCQTLLSQLSANTTRLTDTLTQLTDEILRSGSRLAYEVELLRGDTLALSETLTDGLKGDIETFVPNGLQINPSSVNSQTRSVTPAGIDQPASTLDSSAITRPVEDSISPAEAAEKSKPQVPPYISQLRTLSLVKDRLDEVIGVFGDAMAWTLPPSEVSIASSFISVSAPEPGTESHSREEKGREVSRKLKDEINDLLDNSSSEEIGIDLAAKRVGELRALARVWKGTAEEKARLKFVESLAKLIDERQRELEERTGGKGLSSDRSTSPKKRIESDRKPREVLKNTESTRTSSQARQAGYGLIDQLQRMRGGL